MSYWFTAFGTEPIPAASPTQEIGLPEAAALSLSLPGGRAYDGWGDRTARVRLPYTLSLRAELVAATPAALRTAFETWRKLYGTRDKLYRKLDGGGVADQWAEARLVALTSTRTAQQLLTLPIELVFLVFDDIWRGAAQSVSGALNASPKTFTCPNAGNAAIDDPVVAVTAAGSSITQVTVDIYGVAQMNWSGTLAAGNTLTIDCGARSVRIGTNDAYGGFSLSGDWHKIPEWLRFPPGNTSLHITRTGGNNSSAAAITYNDGWA